MTRILLVEDEADVADMLRLALVSAGHGWEVDVVRDAPTAKVQLGSQPYEVVVADWRIPGGDGLEIANLAADTGAKTILMSGYLFLIPKGDTTRHQLLMKPMRPTELVGSVRQALQAK